MTAAQIIREHGNVLNLRALCIAANVSYFKTRKAVLVRSYLLSPAEESALKAELYKLHEGIKNGLLS